MPDLCDSAVFDKCNKDMDSKGYDEVMKICVSMEFSYISATIYFIHFRKCTNALLIPRKLSRTM